MKKPRLGLVVAMVMAAYSAVAVADLVYQGLPFSQDWTNTGMITANDDWSGVAGITGYLGDSDPAGSVTNVDPRTLTADVAVAVDVIANQAAANSTTGGVAEIDGIANPVVALQGSGTADAPYIAVRVNTTGWSQLVMSYVVRDVDATADNAVQQFNAQYRLGGAGVWTNIPGTYIADASAGPSLTLDTPVSVELPAACGNQAQVEIRFMTTNAGGSDEWVGMDNLSIRPAAQGLPGLPQWAAMVLALALGLAAVVVIDRRRTA